MEAEHRYETPTGGPCPRTVRVDGAVEHGGACFGCGTCLQFGGLVEPEPPAAEPVSAAPTFSRQ